MSWSSMESWDLNNSLLNSHHTDPPLVTFAYFLSVLPWSCDKPQNEMHNYAYASDYEFL